MFSIDIIRRSLSINMQLNTLGAHMRPIFIRFSIAAVSITDSFINHVNGRVGGGGNKSSSLNSTVDRFGCFY